MTLIVIVAGARKVIAGRGLRLGKWAATRLGRRDAAKCLIMRCGGFAPQQGSLISGLVGHGERSSAILKESWLIWVLTVELVLLVVNKAVDAAGNDDLTSEQRDEQCAWALVHSVLLERKDSDRNNPVRCDKIRTANPGSKRCSYSAKATLYASSLLVCCACQIQLPTNDVEILANLISAPS